MLGPVGPCAHTPRMISPPLPIGIRRRRWLCARACGPCAHTPRSNMPWRFTANAALYHHHILEKNDHALRSIHHEPRRTDLSLVWFTVQTQENRSDYQRTKGKNTGNLPSMDLWLQEDCSRTWTYKRPSSAGSRYNS